MAVTEVVRDEPQRSYVDWPAIFAGALVASGIVVVLTAFAAGLGLGSISADDGGDISVTWMIVTAFFAVISMVAAYMLGGYVTGRMRRPAGAATKDELTVRDGLNGLVVWGIGMVLSALLAASVLSTGARAVGGAAQSVVEAAGSTVGGVVQGAGQLAGGVISGAGQIVGGVAQGTGQAAAPVLNDMLPQGAQSNPLEYLTDVLFRTDAPATPGVQAQPGDTAAVGRQVTAILANTLRTGEMSDADRTWIRNQVAARTGLSPQDVDARVNQTVEQVQAVRADAEKKVEEAKAAATKLQSDANAAMEQAKTQAAEVAEQVRVAGILSAFLLAASALVAAAAAYIGAVHGGRHRDEGRVWGGLAYRR